MIDLRYSLIIEATDDPAFFGFYSPDLDGFTGIGHSIEDCLYQARWGMQEHVEVLKERGAIEVRACATHPVFADSAMEALLDSPLSQLVITDTVPLPGRTSDPRIKIVSVASLLAESIRRIHENRSVSVLFD